MKRFVATADVTAQDIAFAGDGTKLIYNLVGASMNRLVGDARRAGATLDLSTFTAHTKRVKRSNGAVTFYLAMDGEVDK